MIVLLLCGKAPSGPDSDWLLQQLANSCCMHTCARYTPRNPNLCVSCAQDVARGILPSWTAIAERRRQMPFSEAQRQWQLLRRGRYLEFNLLYDRGVKFGLDGGRVESIMVRGLRSCCCCPTHVTNQHHACSCRVLLPVDTWHVHAAGRECRTRVPAIHQHHLLVCSKPLDHGVGGCYWCCCIIQHDALL